MIEPPYGAIWHRLKAGKAVPFLGAGASFVGRTPDAKWDPSDPTFLPSGAELASFLAEETRFPSSSAFDLEDLAKVASYYTDVNGRPVLRDRLREILDHDYVSGALHEFLAELPNPMVIVVTNYDTLLEQAFRAAGKPYDLVIHATDRKDFANAVLWCKHGASEPKFREPNKLDQDIDLASTTVIYKMHGTIHRETNRWDNFVITEEDYVDFLSRMTSHTAIPSLF
ncbi:MAG: SIR2 family protein, partial [Burkholderiales bacterium]